jgi:orotate phosphoribosyltransferase-like protein
MKVFNIELICSKKLELNEALESKSKELKLDYKLVASKEEDTFTYGIKISLFGENGESENVIIPDVVSSKTNMVELINRLSTNLVTPVSCFDVISDYIS